MKDFAEQHLLEDTAEARYSPYEYMSPEVQQELAIMRQEAYSAVTFSRNMAEIATIPLQTIITSLQLSVAPHKHIHESPEALSKELARVNTSLTVREKRKLELVLRMGGDQKPYVAPVYSGYRNAIENLKAQGWKAFFKGCGWRLITSVASVYPIVYFDILNPNPEQPKSFVMTLLLQYCYHVFVDCSLNTMQVAENRYILQNNLPDFKVYRNFSKTLLKLFRQNVFTLGISFHMINNIFTIAFRYPFYVVAPNSMSDLTLWCYLVGETLAYPFSTAYKRLVCQTDRVPGMIPLRYSSLRHGLHTIFFEEGIKGLYKGFTLNIVQVMIRAKIMMSIIAAIRTPSYL